MKKRLMQIMGVLSTSIIIFSGVLVSSAHASTYGIDSTFVTGTGPGGEVWQNTVLPDGKIIINGGFTSYNDETVGRIARLTATGTLDTTFNTGTGFNGYVQTVATTTGGNILVGGYFTDYNGTTITGIARITATGTLDTAFDMGTGLTGGDAAALAFDTIEGGINDGDILVGGSFTAYDGTARKNIARLNSDGSIDTGFNTLGTGFNGNITSVISLPNGQILVAGSFSAYGTTTTNQIARLNADGDLDGTFSTGTGFSDSITSVVVLSNGKILVGGNSFSAYNGTTVVPLVLLNVNGDLDDETFTVTAFDDGNIISTAVQSDGKILVGGLMTTNNGATIVGNMVRLNANGTLDDTFNWVPNAFDSNIVNDISIQNDGKLVVSGGFVTYEGSSSPYLVRLFADTTKPTISSVQIKNTTLTIAFNEPLAGSLVPGSGDFVVTERGNPIGVTDSRILMESPSTVTLTLASAVLVGTRVEISYTHGLHVIQDESGNQADAFSNRLVINNTINFIPIDTDFNVDELVGGSVRDIKLQSNGDILVGGPLDYYGGWQGIPVNDIVRIHSDGSLDTEFNDLAGTGFDALNNNQSSVNTIAIQPDGKIIVGGSFNSFNGTTTNNIARLNADGSLDTEFNENIGTGFDDVVQSLAVSSTTGQIVVGGYFTSLNGEPANYLVRLNANGTRDDDFTTAGGSGLALDEGDPYVEAVALQANGSILVGGYFNSYNGEAVNALLRLDAEGVLDTDFIASMDGMLDVYDETYSVFVDPVTGTIFSTGYYANTDSEYLAVFTSTGEYDTDFITNMDGSFDGEVTFVAFDDSERIIFGGNFDNQGSNVVHGIARFSNDGVFDDSFFTADGFSGSVGDIIVQADGKILVAGGSSYNGTPIVKIGRLGPDIIAPSLSEASVNARVLTVSFDEPLNESYSAEPRDFSIVQGLRSFTVDSIDIESDTVTLTLEESVDVPDESAEDVKVSYTPGEYPLQDVSRNEVSPIVDYVPLNETPIPSVEEEAPVIVARGRSGGSRISSGRLGVANATSSQIISSPSVPLITIPLFTFVRNMTVGSSGEDVRNLQKYLNTKGFTISTKGAGSVGNETLFFGSLTQKALAKFQAANGITPAVGYFGPKTREFVRTHP